MEIKRYEPERKQTNNRLSSFDRRLSTIQKPSTFSWQSLAIDDQSHVNFYDEGPMYTRFVINNTVFAIDLIIAFIRREFNELRPNFPRIDFNELKQSVCHHLPHSIVERFNRLLNYLFKRSVFFVN